MWSCPKFCSGRKNWKVDGIPPGWGIFGWESRGNGSTTKALAGYSSPKTGRGEHGSGVSPMDGYGLHPRCGLSFGVSKALTGSILH